jgi:ankyrin repeat protein
MPTINHHPDRLIVICCLLFFVLFLLETFGCGKQVKTLPSETDNLQNSSPIAAEPEEDSIEFDESYQSPFENILEAVEKGIRADVHFFVKRGADVNMQEPTIGYMPIHLAIRKSDIAMVKYLLKNGADVNGKDLGKKTPLYWAILPNNPPRNFKTSFEMIKLLVESGADVNAVAADNITPFYNLVLTNNDLTLVKYLLDHGADVNTPHYTGTTPLDLAIRINNTEMQKFLIEAGGKRGEEL